MSLRKRALSLAALAALSLGLLACPAEKSAVELPGGPTPPTAGRPTPTPTPSPTPTPTPSPQA